MHHVFLGLGSNLGSREESLKKAYSEIENRIGQILKESTIIETPAWGKKDSPNYLNSVIEVQTNLLPLELITTVLTIEQELGRVRTEKWASRIIDIDVLYFNDWHFHTPSLIIPHPFIHLRKFVLEPLAEIAPDMVHPVLRKSHLELLNALG
jgi:2-amino-4-hydroxy-6-hydroxymethyldihydropteridine diphosphokinase